MNARGFTLAEALVALGLLTLVLAGLLPAMQSFMDANTMCEDRSGAVAAAQQVMEFLRQTDVAALPESGASAVQTVRVGRREYEVVVRYCTNSDYCGTGSRHIIVEVNFGGRTIYTVESVFTQLL